MLLSYGKACKSPYVFLQLTRLTDKEVVEKVKPGWENFLPLIMVVAFLLLTLLVGLYYSRKVTSLREYAIGNKQFATATLVATTLATAFGGGGLLRDVQETHAQGLLWILWARLSAPLGYWLWSPLMLRMGPFMHHLSLAESIGSIYGNIPRLVTAFISIVCTIFSLTTQVIAISTAIKICIDLHNNEEMAKTVTIIATCILIGYASFGGVRSVTFTDVLQFITFTVIIPLVAWFMFVATNKSIVEVVSVLQSEPKFQLSSCLQRKKLLAIGALFLTNLSSFIQPTTVQRIYMASTPIQARKLFLYSGIFAFVICGAMTFIGLLLFVKAPMLSKEQIWPYLFKTIRPIFKGYPIFKGLVAVSLIAMAMSTADSILNACAIMISHDMLGSLKIVKAVPERCKLYLARSAALIVGICAMLLAFRFKDLLTLLMLVFNFSVPIVTAPFILAVFGFRGSSPTALIGMLTGTLSILVWNQWILPAIDIDGAFPCMLANGLAMLAAHYVLPQPKGTGWVPPDKIYQQRQQEKERIARRNRKARTTFFLKANLAKLKPNRMVLLLTGIYLIVIGAVSFCYYYYHGNQILYSYGLLLLSGIGLVYIACATYGYHMIPDWLVGKFWFLSLLCCLPLHLLFSYALAKEIVWPLVLLFMHGAVLLWALPLYWNIRVLLMAIGSMMVIYWYKGSMLWPSAVVLLPLLGLGLLMLVFIVYLRYQTMVERERVTYFQQQQQFKESYKLKSLAYALELPTTKNPESQLEKEGEILEKAIQHVTQSISFSDEFTTFYKEDFQTIIHKFSEWATYLKQRAKSQAHALLQPTAIDIEDFIDEVEVAYEKEYGILPGLWIEKVEVAGAIPAAIISDREQLVQLLVMAISYTTKTNTFPHSIITIQLHTTHLQYKKSEPLEGSYPPLMVFPALALLLSHSQADPSAIPEVESIYGDDIEDQTKPHDNATIQTQLNLKKQEMERIVRAHYGYMALPHSDAILLVIPRDVTQIKEEMLAVSLPREAGTSEENTLIPQEQAKSLTKLVDFHDWVCTETAVEPTVISEILLLLRRCYGFKRHACGQLFYLRSVGIATWVARWVNYHPKLIYAALLYDLVRYTRLPLSYIKANYNLGVLCFVENVLSIDSHSELEESLLAVSNRFKGALEKEQLSVLYIKLAERLYDLEHADGYGNCKMVKSMAKESLAIDVKLAKRYLNPEIAVTLAQVAGRVLS